jgi:hypothetical protein
MPPINRFLCLALCLANAALAEDATVALEIRAPHAMAGRPDAFALGYRMREQDVSPDNRFGVIHADMNVIDAEAARNFLVALDPFRILAVNEGFAYFHPGNHREMAVQWAKDSSAVLVMVGDKWGTVGATLFELHDGRVTRRTDIMAAITSLLAAKFPKGKVEPYNNWLRFILDGETEFDLSEDGGQIRIDVSATNNPNLSPGKTWEGTLKALWSVPAARWIEHKVAAKISPKNSE